MQSCDIRNDIVKSLTNYILTHNIESKSVFNIYNGWSEETGLAPDDPETAEWTLYFLADIKDINPDLLHSAYDIDSKI